MDADAPGVVAKYRGMAVRDGLVSSHLDCDRSQYMGAPGGHERAGQLRRLLPQFPVGGAIALRANDQRVAVAEAIDRAPEVGANGFAEQWDETRSVEVRVHGATGYAHAGFQVKVNLCRPVEKFVRRDPENRILS